MQQGQAFQDHFSIRQLIFVNSAAYAFTEIRVDQHTVLFGRNNLGKTSMLNALKLFLLPEVNFNNCPSKFAFKSSKGEVYEGTQSYQYYFPEDTSFIILEASNVHGDFCLLLHRGSRELSYGRMAVPLPWHQLRHLFWDVTAGENEGLGGPVDDFGLKSVLSRLQCLDAEPLSEGKLIRERLFGEHPLDPERGRFSLLPFRQGGKAREIDAWRQLIHLAFDISARDDRTLPTTLATIIEGEKQRAEEQVDVDLVAVLDEYHELRNEADALQRVRNNLQEWLSFDRRYQAYHSDSIELAQQFCDYHSALSIRIVQGEKAVTLAQKAFKEADEQFELNRKRFSRQADSLKELNGQVTANEGTLQGYEKKMREIAKIRDQFDEHVSIDEVVEALKQQQSDFEQRHEDLTNAAQRRERMEGLVTRQKQLSSKVKNQQELLEANRPAFLESLDTTAATVLLNLNPSFAHVGSQPTPEQIKLIEAFSALFTVFPEKIDFLGETLCSGKTEIYDPDQHRALVINSLEKDKEALTKTEKELRDLNTIDRRTASEIRLELGDLRSNIRKTKDDISLIKSAEQLNQDHTNQSEKVQDQKRQRDELSHEVEQLRLAHDHLSRALDEKQRVQDATKKAWEADGRCRSDLVNRITALTPAIKARAEKMEPNSLDVTEDNIRDLVNRAATLKENGEEIKTLLTRLLRSELLEDLAENAYKSDYNLSELRHFHQQFRQLFDNLPAREHNHRDCVSAHNKQTAIKIDELRNAANQIKTFESELNREFSDYRVSNLEAIRVGFELHPRFETLLREMETVNFHDNERLYDQSLYNRLNDFCDQFFRANGSSTSTLSMEQIIQKVAYRYRLEGQEQFDDKEQSNGTTSMVNCLLLSILLKRLMRKDASISVPLVMDEMGSLDRENLETAISIADDHGFSLFGANPDISSEIVSAVRNYVTLGAFVATTRAYHEDRRVIYHGQCERLVPVVAEINTRMQA